MECDLVHMITYSGGSKCQHPELMGSKVQLDQLLLSLYKRKKTVARQLIGPLEM